MRKSLWFDTARWFVTLPVDAALYKLLERLGILHGADRAWLALLSKDHVRAQVSHEWDAPGMTSTIGKSQVQSVADYRWIYKKLLFGKEVAFNISDIPPRFDSFRRHLSRQGVQSFYAVPIYVGKIHVGALGYHKVTSTRKWTHLERKETRRAAALIGEWLENKEPAPPPPSEDSGNENTSLFIKHDRTSTRVPISKIIMIEAALNYSRIHMVGGKPLLQYGGFGDWDKNLPVETFLRIHRSYIVNIDKVAKLNRNGGAWKITMVNERVIPVGRMFRSRLLSKIENLRRISVDSNRNLIVK